MQAGAQEVVAAAVHVALVQGIAHGVALLRAGSAEGVVAPTGIGDDGQQRVTEVRIQHAAAGQIRVVLTTQRALGVVAFARFIRVIKQRVYRLIPFEVEQAQSLPLLHFKQVGFTCRDYVAKAGVLGLFLAGYGHLMAPYRAKS